MEILILSGQPEIQMVIFCLSGPHNVNPVLWKINTDVYQGSSIITSCAKIVSKQ